MLACRRRLWWNLQQCADMPSMRSCCSWMQSAISCSCVSYSCIKLPMLRCVHPDLNTLALQMCNSGCICRCMQIYDHRCCLRQGLRTTALSLVTKTQCLWLKRPASAVLLPWWLDSPLLAQLPGKSRTKSSGARERNRTAGLLHPKQASSATAKR